MMKIDSVILDEKTRKQTASCDNTQRLLVEQITRDRWDLWCVSVYVWVKQRKKVYSKCLVIILIDVEKYDINISSLLLYRLNYCQ